MKKKFFILGLLLIIIISVFCCLHYFLNKYYNTIELKNGDKVRCIKDSKPIFYFERFKNDLVFLEIPKNWQVTELDRNYFNYSVIVYNQKNKNYSIFLSLKLDDFRFENNQLLTTELFYKNMFNQIEKKGFPKMSDFTVLKNLGKTSYGGDVLRATYKSENGELVEGIFTATLDINSKSAYNVSFITTPIGEFEKWGNIIVEKMQHVRFSEKFVNAYNEKFNNNNIILYADQESYYDFYDEINKKFPENINSEIAMQKEIDALSGYERVYNTKTNKIYKAYRGFMEDYSGLTYKPIPDNLYIEPISGYIIK